MNRNVGTSNHIQRVCISNDVEFGTIAMKNDISYDMWILDSAASCHFIKVLTDFEEVEELIRLGNGKSK
jgi:hypothetical protein